MSIEEIKIVEALARAFNALPDEKKEYMLGYAEGVAAMYDQKLMHETRIENYSEYAN